MPCWQAHESPAMCNDATLKLGANIFIERLGVIELVELCIQKLLLKHLINYGLLS